MGAYSGLIISLSAGTIIKATLTTSPASAATSITAGMQVACLRFDAEANIYTYIDGATYNADKTMTVDLPKAGFYAFVSASASVSIPLPTLYAEARVTSSASVKTISYAGGELTLEVQTTTNNTITCTKKSNGTAADPMHKRSIGTFFDIELDTEEKVKKGEIKYKYDSTAVAAVSTDPSRSTYTYASKQTQIHRVSASLSLTHARTHTRMHARTYIRVRAHTHNRIHVRTFFLVRTVYITTVCPHDTCVTRVRGAHTRAHLLSGVHTCSQRVVSC